MLPPVPRAPKASSREEQIVRAVSAAQADAVQQPLPPGVQRPPQAPPVELIQRQPAPEPAPIEVSQAPVAQATIVQRAEVDDEDLAEDLSATDLTQLAHRVLPFVKRLLAIERERRSARA